MQERGEFNRVANKLSDSVTEDSAGAGWLSTTLDRPMSKRAADVIMANIRASAKSHRGAEKSEGPPAKAPPPGMQQDVRSVGGAGSNDPMPQPPRAADARDAAKARPAAVDVRLTDNTGKGPVARRDAEAKRALEEEEYRMAERPEEVRAHRVDTRQAGNAFRGPVSDYVSEVFWGNQVRFLKGDVKVAHE